MGCCCSRSLDWDRVEKMHSDITDEEAKNFQILMICNLSPTRLNDITFKKMFENQKTFKWFLKSFPTPTLPPTALPKTSNGSLLPGGPGKEFLALENQTQQEINDKNNNESSAVYVNQEERTILLVFRAQYQHKKKKGNLFWPNGSSTNSLDSEDHGRQTCLDELIEDSTKLDQKNRSMLMFPPGPSKLEELSEVVLSKSLFDLRMIWASKIFKMIERRSEGYKIIVAGCSFGGLIALKVAAKYNCQCCALNPVLSLFSDSEIKNLGQTNSEIFRLNGDICSRDHNIFDKSGVKVFTFYPYVNKTLHPVSPHSSKHFLEIFYSLLRSQRNGEEFKAIRNYGIVTTGCFIVKQVSTIPTLEEANEDFWHKV